MERDLLAQLASKSDLENLRSALEADIDPPRASTQSEMQLLRASMTIRLGSMLVVGLSLLFATLKLT